MCESIHQEYYIAYGCVCLSVIFIACVHRCNIKKSQMLNVKMQYWKTSLNIIWTQNKK